MKYDIMHKVENRNQECTNMLGRLINERILSIIDNNEVEKERLRLLKKSTGTKIWEQFETDTRYMEQFWIIDTEEAIEAAKHRIYSSPVQPKQAERREVIDDPVGEHTNDPLWEPPVGKATLHTGHRL